MFSGHGFFSNKHSSIAYKVIRSAPTAFEQRLNLLPDFRLCLSHRLVPHCSNSDSVYFNRRHGLLRRRRLESIAKPGFGADELRSTWIGLNFPAELSNEDAKILRFSAVSLPPDGLKHYLMSDRLSLIRDK